MTTALLLLESLPTHLTTVAEFDLWQRQHVIEGSYEFIDGEIIPKESIKQDEIFITAFLQRVFTKTNSYQKGDELLIGVDSYINATRKRVPDLAYFTAEEVQQMRQGARLKSRFAIEILSDSESFENVQDYFDAGGRLVWYIVPKQQKIYVYTHPDESKAYKGSDLITATPVVEDFQFKVGDMFA